ncbi:MAG: phage protease [Paracoccaceae bacterium]|nr:phage protease [Paracoccaceae bacterium]
MTKKPFIELMAAMPLPEPQADGALVWIHLLPAGPVLPTSDGRGPYRVASLQAVIAGSAKGKLPVDENHAIDLAAPHGGASPARGHIIEMQARADGIWGQVEWTASGRALMADKAYLGISPVITHDPDMTITGILRASLTNRPNLAGLTALHQSQEMTMPLKAIAEALGLAGDATEEAILAAIRKASGEKPDIAALQSAMGQIGVVLGVPQDAGPAAVLLAARVASQGDSALQSQLVALQSQLTAVTEGQARRDAVAFVDAERAKGATAVNEQTRDDLVALHMTNAVVAEKLIKGAPYLPRPLSRSGTEENPALQAGQSDLIGRARAYQATQKVAGNDVDWTSAVLAVSENQK